MMLPLSDISVRAMKSAEFRERIRVKPRTTIAQTYDIEVPKAVKLRVLEDSAERVHLVIPAAPGERGQEIGVIATTLDRVRSDPAFKARVIRDPKGTFSETVGIRLPDQLEVVVVEDTAELIHLQLPPARRDGPNGPDPVVLATDSYGGGEPYGGGGPAPDSVGPDCTSLAGNNSSTAICCHTDFVTIGSAWDCCPVDEPGGGEGGVFRPF